MCFWTLIKCFFLKVHKIIIRIYIRKVKLLINKKISFKVNYIAICIEETLTLTLYIINEKNNLEVTLQFNDTVKEIIIMMMKLK